MKNRNLYTTDWYRDASVLLKELQEETQEKEDKEWQSRRKVALDQLGEELAQLEEFATGSHKQLVENLFQTFPPKHR